MARWWSQSGHKAGTQLAACPSFLGCTLGRSQTVRLGPHLWFCLREELVSNDVAPKWVRVLAHELSITSHHHVGEFAPGCRSAVHCALFSSADISFTEKLSR